MDAIILPMALALAAAACGILYYAMRRPATVLSIEERLAQVSDRQLTLEEIELAQPFGQRVVAPFFLQLARFFSKFTPRHNTEALRIKLIEAGSPS